MSAWDDLLASTYPGREVEMGAQTWLILRRSYSHPNDSVEGRDDRMTITVELVRSGSPADPREIHPTPPREDPTP